MHYLRELVGALEEGDEEYVVAAPMLYESKPDGSLAAHATQSNLRLVQSADGQRMVRHDHSPKMAFRREFSDLKEEEQVGFLEDHGFVIRWDEIKTAIDPSASFTMEYLDMIMSINAEGHKVLFVPTARLEFNIYDFTWRDIPYFMYKRSEATALGTRDYLIAKWGVQFPNTGFWTFIKYTIVELHTYSIDDDDTFKEWHEQAMMVFGWFQMVGWNRYDGGAFLEQLAQLDDPARRAVIRQRCDAGIKATRQTMRPTPTNPRPTRKNITDIVPTVKDESWLKLEADMPTEYLPFAVARLELAAARDADVPALAKLCSLLIDHGPAGGATCWINLPAFTSKGLAASALETFASFLKVPSRISTYFEMMYMDYDIERHVQRLRRFERESGLNFTLTTCAGARVAADDTATCDLGFTFPATSRLVRFAGMPSSPAEVELALQRLLLASR